LLVVYVAANIGFSSAFLNPFTVGIAQEMAALPMFSGMGYRIFCWLVLTAACIAFTLWYASRIKRPDRISAFQAPEPVKESHLAPKADFQAREPHSPVPEPIPVLELVEGPVVRQCSPTDPVSSGRMKAILLILLLTVVLLVVGVTKFGWYMAEISALFLGMGILCGIVAGFGANHIADLFLAGAKDILSAALVVGLASGIILILQDGHIMDSILHGMEKGLGESGKTASLTLMYGIQTLINLVIPSATAKAAVTIPVMAPFCDMIGLSRQTMVLAFQFGDGFTNMLTPTSGVLIAALGMAKVPYSRWLGWVWKYVIALILAGFVLLLPPVLFSIAGF
ncbi:MAG: YfcC family protein, partial [Bacteroidales bacterium]|nr:YfcC family protein [Bacteroidales bacterium]